MKSITLFFIALFIISCLPAIHSQESSIVPTDSSAIPTPTSSDTAASVSGSTSAETGTHTGSATTSPTPGTAPGKSGAAPALKDEMFNVAAAGLVAAVVAFF
ncbi:4191_t:CDS:2 [Funneliformis caledonium]|uniref:4191_t:CDS:1 n=1 Tax=Funneliformis caledonium TaxID=1117310 RepID=A0A9N9EJG7_9GLOM|nr:4191_t:CDS:2 [Funneliformis caledonium]